MPMDGTIALDALVEAGELKSYDCYRGQLGDDLLYLVFPSGRELHIRASIVGAYSILRVKVPEKHGVSSSGE